MTDNLRSPAPPVRAKFHEGAAEYFSSRNHKAPVSSKHSHLRIDSEPHNGSCPAMTASAVNGLNQFTKRQCVLAILAFCGDKVFDDLRGGGHGARGLIRPSMRETGRECR